MLMIEKSIENALREHSAGRMAEAEAMYRKILAEQPDYAPALHLLGVALSQQGNKRAGIEYISRAISKNPQVADFHSNLALVYLENGEPQQAVGCAQRALALKPDHADALNHLGNALKQLGKLEDSVECYRRAIAIRPDFTVAMGNLVDSLRRLGRAAEAEACQERILTVRPDDATALCARGETLLRQNKISEAGEIFQKIIDRWPNEWVGHNGLGVVRNREGKLDPAIALYEKALSLAPDHPGPWNNLGYARVAQGRIDEGIACYGKALAARPDFADAHNNLGNAYLARMDLDSAMRSYEKALFFQPDHPDGHWNRSLLALLRGDFERGWLEYEWRWLKFPEQRRHLRQPLWDGYDIAGKTILLHAEQGLGDTIQFIRLAPLVAGRGATVNLECQRELFGLMQHIPGVARTVCRGDALPPFDVHCPLLTLPRALGLTLQSIPRETPYLSVDENLRRKWATRLQPHASEFKVGIVWAGARTHPRDAERSIGLDSFAPLAALPGVRLFSLQKGGPAGTSFDLLDLTPELHDFADTAALVLNLDLVIGVDTSVVHLAGALGRPVWTLLPFSPDWRWLPAGDESPWYPTMRLFRQPEPGNWQAVFDRVVLELKSRR